jgi:hypothetical protein
MRTRKVSWVMAPSSLHLTNSATVTLAIRDVMGNKVGLWGYHLWHEVHTKFHENPFRNYPDIKCAQRGIAGETLFLVDLGQVRLSVWKRRWSWPQALSLHDFKQPSRWYQRTKKCVWSNHLWHTVHEKFPENPYRNYLVTKCAHRYHTQDFGLVTDEQAQTNIGNGVLDAPLSKVSFAYSKA